MGTAQLSHIDSTQFGVFANWTVDALEFEDTVRVENDTIFGLAVEPIPPEVNPTTNRIRWSFPSDQLWCTNWPTNTDPPSNAENCSTVIVWDRDGHWDAAGEHAVGAGHATPERREDAKTLGR